MALADLWVSESYVHRYSSPYYMQTIGVRPLLTDYHVMGLPVEKTVESNNFIAFSPPRNLFPSKKTLPHSQDSVSTVQRTERQEQYQQKVKSKSFPAVKEKLRSCCKANKSSPFRKSVHFADAYGLPLVKEISYLRDAEVEQFSMRERQAQWREPGGLELRHKSIHLASEIPKRSLPEVVFVFAQPSSEPDFFTRVENNNVSLENIKREGPCVQGYVRVTNIAFNKKVQVRWTINNWHTHQDLDCVYSHSVQESHTDSFTFKLPLSGEQMELALHYHVDGKDYWDSNAGKNYKITIKR